MNKKDLAGYCVTGLITVGVLYATYSVGGRDERNSVRELVRVTCQKTITFGWQDPDSTEPLYFTCQPHEPPLEIRGTEPGSIVLP